MTDVSGGDLVNLPGPDCHLGLKLLFCSVLIFYYWLTKSYFAIFLTTQCLGREGIGA